MNHNVKLSLTSYSEIFRMNGNIPISTTIFCRFLAATSSSLITPFLFDKNPFYKNNKAQNHPKIKNIRRFMFLRSLT